MRRAISVAGVVLLMVGAVASAGEIQQSAELAISSSSHPGFFVTNDASHPVPVVEQGSELRPFQMAITTDGFGSQRGHTFSVDVPAGKILVLEMATITAIVEPGQSVRADVSLQNRAIGSSEFGVVHNKLKLGFVPGFGPGDYYEGTQAIHGYGAGGDALIAEIERNSTTGPGGRITFSFSGYLVDIPAEAAK
jgi:hypothetical protein